MVEIFKGSRNNEMYLYVDQKVGTDSVPKELLENFGTLESVLIMSLNEHKKLAREKASSVLQSITENGYFLQMPPKPKALADAQIAAMIKAEEELSDGKDKKPNR
ncbi:YcgL domain-containing protein [Litorivicinus sp.]|nr:YcgL domain-containing protein [Litorivicinus sp.]